MKGQSRGTWILTEQERNTYWQTTLDFKNVYFNLKRQGQLPPDWNAHDTGIITELERQARPFEHGGEQQRDPFESQLKKHAKAARKLFAAMGDTKRVTFKQYVKLLGIQHHEQELTRWEVRDHMDTRRNLASLYNVALDEPG